MNWTLLTTSDGGSCTKSSAILQENTGPACLLYWEQVNVGNLLSLHIQEPEKKNSLLRGHFTMLSTALSSVKFKVEWT